MHVGAEQTPQIHAWAHALNEALGGRGTTFELIESVAHEPIDQSAALSTLIADMQAGQVSHLVIIDSNPVYTAPAQLGFAEALKRVPFSLALANHADETAHSTTWFVPKTHDWESWSDARAYDGTTTILQPQALPLYGGTSAHELLSLYLDSAPPSSESLVRSTWTARFWRGVREGVARCACRGPRLRDCECEERAAPARRCRADRVGKRGSSGDLTILFRADASLWDGRHANNPWLQELPRPLTKLVWDNPLLIASALAQRWISRMAIWCASRWVVRAWSPPCG